MTARLAPPASEILHPITRDARVVDCETAAGLGALNRPGVTMAIWRRSPPVCPARGSARRAAGALAQLRILVRPADLRSALTPLFAGAGLSGGEMPDLLVGDIEVLVSAFSGIAKCDLVDVRLERITDNACSKFHRDNVDLRLLTTYRGATTQWVAPAYAAQALREQKAYTGPLERLQVHDVAVFKGRSGDPEEGIVHRSPPIAGLGLVRWLLCLNKPTLVSPEPWSDGMRRSPASG
ncbi:conserved hypothetical protein [uncultured Defluviicoccus sp.]|uniref:DUF1826 domain-containing protein n=1 Tax=metagenome TaxID=256318 RepID=A0A380TFM9_9ZZZZ|nr:conserved hypothetical protein [uncultured Defluviicoccus sp.]